MLNPLDTGRAIAILRKEAGYTQASLAEVLEVSDKAVSKWERGITCPDISLLPKLSVLLDTDIEGLFTGVVTPKGRNWSGILVLDNLATAQVYSKPMVHFLLQNFLLVGIRNILIIGGNVKSLLGSGEQYGIRLRYSSCDLTESLLNHREFIDSNTMIIYGNTLIYGANLTRKYQAMMFHMDDAVALKTDGGVRVPLIFCPENCWKRKENKISCWKNPEEMVKDIHPIEKKFTRGVVALPMNDIDQIMTASRFVQIVEQSEGREMADLIEIARSRGLKQSCKEGL